MIVILRTRIDKRGRNTVCMRVNALNELPHSFRAGNWCAFEDMRGPYQGHHADRDFLPVHPIWTHVRGVCLCEDLEIFPEGFGIFMLLCGMIRAAQYERPAETRRLPNEFDVRSWRAES